MKTAYSIPKALLLLLISLLLFQCDIVVPPILKASKATFALKVKLSWSPVTDSRQYKIYRTDWVNTTTPETLTLVQIGQTTDTTFDDLKVISGKRYL